MPITYKIEREYMIILQHYNPNYHMNNINISLKTSNNHIKITQIKSIPISSKFMYTSITDVTTMCEFNHYSQFGSQINKWKIPTTNSFSNRCWAIDAIKWVFHSLISTVGCKKLTPQMNLWHHHTPETDSLMSCAGKPSLSILSCLLRRFDYFLKKHPITMNRA